jgi:acetyltransferase-like isoleucine patch superfamily enzyme
VTAIETIPMQARTLGAERATARGVAADAANELRTSALAPALLGLHRVLNGGKRWKVGRAICSMLLRLEGRAFRSASVRRILREHHGVEVGAYSYGDCMIPGVFPPGVTIGRFTSISPGVRVYNQNHPLDHLSTHPFFYDPRLGLLKDNPLPRGELVIGHDVWIGVNAVILPGCRRIGTGAVIGAGAIVTKDVDDFAIVAGNPAKTIKHRFDEPTRERILASKWWELPIDRVATVLDAMLKPVAGDNDAASHPLLKGGC